MNLNESNCLCKDIIYVLNSVISTRVSLQSAFFLHAILNVQERELGSCKMREKMTQNLLLAATTRQPNYG